MRPSYARIRLALGCGVAAEEFKRQFDGLSQREQEVLAKVAWRMKVANIIRYRVRFCVPFDVGDWADLAEFNHSELPSLELFYLFGCLDTLAGSDHLPYPQWLKQEHEQGRLNLIHGGISLSWLMRIFETYQQQHGVGSRLRRIFGSLPDATVDWLLAHVAIYRTIGPRQDGAWLDPAKRRRLDERKKVIDHWRAFFYELHRNPFAHQSTAQDIYLPEDMMRASKASGEWELRSGTMHYLLNDAWWSMAWKAEIDESVVLRVLIQGSALTMLGIPVSAHSIEMYVRSLLRVRVFTGFRDEVDRNAANLANWATLLEANTDEPADPDLPSLASGEMGELEDAWSWSVMDKFDTQSPREGDLRQHTRGYIDSIRELNRQIASFNADHPYGSSRAARAQDLIPFWTQQAAGESFARALAMPRLLQVIGRIDQLLANPCHIYFTEV